MRLPESSLKPRRMRLKMKAAPASFVTLLLNLSTFAPMPSKPLRNVRDRTGDTAELYFRERKQPIFKADRLFSVLPIFCSSNLILLARF